MFGNSFTGESMSVDCATYDAVKYQVGALATKTCTDGVYGATDVSLCQWVHCPLSGDWIATADGVTASIDCDLVDSVHYSNAQQATRLCTQSVWGEASDGYAKTWTNGTASKACSNLDGDHTGIYEGGEAVVTCTNNSDNTAAQFSTPDVTACTAKQCLAADSEP